MLVVAQKAVSKVEGRVVTLSEVEPSPRARELAGDRDPRRMEVILGESREIVRTRPPLVIAETHHGFVCASAGVDSSNAKGPDRQYLRVSDLRILAHSELECALNDGHTLRFRMRVRWNMIAVRHTNSHYEHPFLRWITL